MKNEQEYSATDNLLARYLAGDADASETAAAEAWIAASEENRRYFESMKKAWEATANAHAAHRFDTDAAWEKLQARMHESGGHASPARKNFSWAIAAGIALLIGISFIAYRSFSGSGAVQSLMIVSTNLPMNDTLPDGSRISLNKNSKLDYPSAFGKGSREVKLSGEAFFDVAHDAAHPFVIHTPLMDVKVLGTSFNVTAYPNSDSVYVTVTTGRVQCAANGDTVVITPGEFAVLYKNNGKIRKGTEDDPNRASYHDRIFKFSNTPLFLAVQRLNEAYGCNIILKNDKLKTCAFSSTKVFKNEPVENIILVIEATLPGITSQNEGNNTIILDGPGCQ